jgi:manganese oxidase
MSESISSVTGRTRRSFLRESAVAALSVGVLNACRGKAAEAVAAATTTTPPPSPSAAADAMDAMCEKGVKAFPATTQGKGNVPIAPRVENGVKIFDLTATKIQWEIAPGQLVEAFGYNGIVPGPQIRVREGDRVRLNLKNGLDQSTSIHFHGLSVPNDQDGVRSSLSRPSNRASRTPMSSRCRTRARTCITPTTTRRPRS